ncbi:siderophore-interacting protein [Nocardioides sp. SYSU D00038]|uniref:siderophore-interacting protein n=1 Tax=Nocardioides sp. SYSU D00038 TaxID=2812554 RepID=UPI0019670394|nr:siderophore-interacting protein [Nocardioides sp. SYSU D00038]
MHARVRSTARITPSLVRVVLGDGDLDGFVAPDETDAYVNVAIPPAEAPYDAVFDPQQVRADHPAEVQPARRRYTVRSWDPTARELTIDFVVHGTEGVAGPWAEAARPGDVLVFEGPSGGYRPDPEADWHLMVGDESALPAIAASLEAVPAGAPVVVRLVCDGPDHELELTTPGRLDLAWLHRTGVPADATLLADSLRDLAFPEGRVHAFVHGEAEEVRAVRRHLLADRGLPRAEMSCSPYWRRTMTDEAWRRVKREFVAAMEADVG